VTMLSLAHLSVIDAAPLDLIDAAAAGGFDAIGLRIVPPTPTDVIVPVVGDEPLIRQILRRLNDTGIHIHDVEAVWLMPQTDVADLKPALELGWRLGARNLLVVGNDPDGLRMEANFGALCELAHEAGLGVALEPMSYVALRSWRDGLAALRKVRPTNAALLIDALHFYRAGGTKSELAEIDPTWLRYIHLCDAIAAPPPPDGLRAEGRRGRFYPGEGELPLADFLCALPAGIPIAVEAPCARYAELSVVERARICGAATRALLSGVFGRKSVRQA
jgi:sugar phosphate isomerase/epimerase